MRIRPFRCCLVLVALVALGCHSQSVDLEAWMQPPPRPTELDQLAVFVGEWEGTLEARVPGSDSVLTGSGTARCTWDAGTWVLTEHMDYRVGKSGRMQGISVWRWDPAVRRFRIFATDSCGGVGEGEAWYDVAANTWHMRCKQRYASGTRAVAESTIRFSADNNTQEWVHQEWDGLRLIKKFEMKGTSRRHTGASRD